MAITEKQRQRLKKYRATEKYRQKRRAKSKTPKVRAYMQRWWALHRLRRKLRIYDAYGGRFCCWCGDADLLALTIDHINNNGAQHRKQISNTRERGCTSEQFHGWLVRHNFPPGFQILCSSCNTAKERNGGILPESRRKPTPDEWFERTGVGGI